MEGQRTRGRPSRRFLDSVKNDLNGRGYEWRCETLWLAGDSGKCRGIVEGEGRSMKIDDDDKK